MTHGLTEALVEAVHAPAPRSGELDELVAERIVDTVGVAIGGLKHSSVRAAAALAVPAGTGATSWADGHRCGVADAAVVNATAAHALDFDDVLDRMTGHPSAVLIPALLAIADAAGEQEIGPVADAYRVGVQVAAALAAGLDIRGHYDRGWHSSSTIGVVAATGALARLRGSTAEHTVAAIGLATSSACGLRQNFGSDTKPLHVGLAAGAAIRAVQLAEAGATADPHALDGPRGYLAVLGGAADPRAALDVLEGPSVLETHGVNTKRYPCCYEVQRAADAALELSGHDLVSLTLTVHPGGTRPLAFPEARTGQEACFSAPYVVAAGVLDGRVDLDSFTDTAVLRPEIRRLMTATTVVEAERPPTGPPGWTEGYAVLSAVDAAGHTHTVRIDDPAGHARRRLTAAQLADKIGPCLRRGRPGTEHEVWSLLRHVSSPGGLGRLIGGLAMTARNTARLVAASPARGA